MRTETLQSPYNGLNKNWSASTQPQYTSPDMNNVRPRSVLDNRTIIGQRPGLKKAYQQCIGGANNLPVVSIAQITVVEL